MERLIQMTVSLLLLLLAALTCTGLQTDYMTVVCNGTISGHTSGRFETSSALTYDNQMNCITTITVAANMRVLLLFKRFELEAKVGGKCVDTLDIHDGPTIKAAKFNGNTVLCGVQSIHNYTATGQDATFHFQSDNNAVFRGWETIYVAFHTGQCLATEFQCTNTLCIDSTLKCDTINQCGDGSDEANCDEKKEEEATNNNTGLIVGCSMGGVALLLICALVAYKVYDHYRWKRWLEDNKLDRQPWESEEELQYPVTDKYMAEKTGQSGRRAFIDVAPVAPSDRPKSAASEKRPLSVASENSSVTKQQYINSEGYQNVTFWDR